MPLHGQAGSCDQKAIADVSYPSVALLFLTPSIATICSHPPLASIRYLVYHRVSFIYYLFTLLALIQDFCLELDLNMLRKLKMQ